MSAVAVKKSGAGSGASRRGLGLLAARILRMEIRHSAFVWSVPLLAVLFVYDPYRTASGYPALWPLRSTVVLNKFWPDMVIFAAGFSAWAGSREGRREVGDLLAATVRPAWTRQLCSLAGTAFWVVAVFLAGVLALYVRTSQQATWGGPPLWPVIVGATGMLAVCAVAFTVAALFPGRFTAPIVAVCLMLVTLIAFRQAVGSNGGPVVVLSPDGSVPSNDWGLFYRTSAGVPIVQVMFMGGVTLAAAGLLGLSSRTGGVGWRGALSAVSAGGARTRIITFTIFSAGIALAVAGAVLAGTWTGSPATGYTIPALDGTTGNPIPYTPVCADAAGGFPVCVHPAYRDDLHEAVAAFGSVMPELSGLPGAPVRAREIFDQSLPATPEGNAGGQVVNGVYEFTMDSAGPGWVADQNGLSQGVVHAMIVTTAGDGTPAQQAVQDGLLRAIGSQPYPVGGASSGPGNQTAGTQPQVAAAAAKFAALPAASRRSWLAANLAALRAGTTTLEQVP